MESDIGEEIAEKHDCKRPEGKRHIGYFGRQ